MDNPELDTNTRARRMAALRKLRARRPATPRPKSTERVRRYHESAQGWASKHIANIIRRSKRKGLEVGITRGELDALLKAALATGKFPTLQFGHPSSPSPDRKDSTKGYVPGNVQIVPLWYNYAKNRWPEEQVHAAMNLSGWHLA